MRMRSLCRLRSRYRKVLTWAGAGLVLGTTTFPCLAAEQATSEEAPAVAERAVSADGRELFLREWLPNDPRSHGGDGLGPVFNESSCVSCHNQGGPGGGGAASKNVDIISAFQNQFTTTAPHVRRSLPEVLFHGLFGDLGGTRTAATIGQPVPGTGLVDNAADQAAKAARQRARDELAKIHPGFGSARSVVLHRFSTDDGYEGWRSRMRGFNVGFHGIGLEQQAESDAETEKFRRRILAQQALQQAKLQAQMAQHGSGVTSQIGNFAVVTSQRNPTALFGVGLIDSIPDDVLEAAAEQKFPDFPEISGRVARLKEGEIGRFGWKAQKATLEDFTLTACAVELGLQVPGHDQAGVPQRPDYQAPGLDLTAEECKALEQYMADLSAPRQLIPSSEQEREILAAGEKHFQAVGCANCHTPKLGEVAGIYSDLLLHDMGNELGDTGDYGVFVPNTPDEEQEEEIISITDARSNREPSAEDLKKLKGALRQEWRTPPLWGVRDSAPYLHDGRAETLEEAIALHGGEGLTSAQRYFELEPTERQQLTAFLKSLVAPTNQVENVSLSKK